MKSNRKARLLFRQRLEVDDLSFADLVAWEVPEPVRGSAHLYKYRLAYVRDGRCLIRYDNEAGKGDHRHIEDVEVPYVFVSVARLVADFRSDIAGWRKRK